MAISLIENQKINQQVSSSDNLKNNYHFDWQFFVLSLLFVLLSFVIYFLANTYLNKPISLELGNVEGVYRLHVFKLDAFSDGFLVLQTDQGGVPATDMSVSPYIQSGQYRDFYMKIGEDDSDAAKDPAYYGNIRTTLGDRFYVIFYKDKDGNGVYDKSVDNVPLTDIFGRKLQAIVVAGEQI